jgi:hypothetical protein
MTLTLENADRKKLENQKRRDNVFDEVSASSEYERELQCDQICLSALEH